MLQVFSLPDICYTEIDVFIAFLYLYWRKLNKTRRILFAVCLDKQFILNSGR